MPACDAYEENRKLLRSSNSFLSTRLQYSMKYGCGIGSVRGSVPRSNVLKKYGR